MACSIGGAIDGAGLEKSRTNGEVGTERQRRSVALCYADDVDAVSNSNSLVGILLNG